ncbi:MAG: hypothetical protein U5R49_03065 [Deltaproteobacteria bacterium]|nr:hypothetical protein [Deltaproteobacteria bacterium]
MKGASLHSDLHSVNRPPGARGLTIGIIQELNALVGRIEYYHLEPMTFSEFLAAVEPALTPHTSDFRIGNTIPLAAHLKMLKRHREFLFVGGMPEAVAVFSQENAVSEVTAVHRSIAETYQDDFSKYAKQKDLVLMQRVFRQIPRMIGQKVKYSSISREDRSRNVKATIDLLAKARVCHQVFPSHIQSEWMVAVHRFLLRCYRCPCISWKPCREFWRSFDADHRDQSYNKNGAHFCHSLNFIADDDSRCIRTETLERETDALNILKILFD